MPGARARRFWSRRCVARRAFMRDAGASTTGVSCVEIERAEELCRTLIEHHLGPSWSFRWDRAVRRFGVCRWDERIISVSRHLVELNNEAAVLDTVLHEIAHGLAPRRAGHGPTWQRIAASLGARPERVLDAKSVHLPQPSFVGRCPSCSWQTRAHRRQRVACRRCCVAYNGGRYTSDFEIAWERASELTGSCR